MVRRIFGVLLAGLVLIVMVSSTGATAQAQNGKIAFARDGNIWTIDPSGSGAVRITSGTDMGGPVWAPDGQRIALVQNGVGLGGYGNALFVMRADGTSRIKVSGTLRGSIQAIRWSPDGTRLAFSDDLFDASPRVGAIIVARADGSGQDVLTGYGSLNSDPTWAPDGSKIWFSSDRDGDADVFVMASNGSGVQKLTLNRVNEFDPMVAPDGTRIAFARQTKQNLALFTMKADGTAPVQVTNVRRASDRFPVWSPDGLWIAFWRTTAGRAGTTRIYRMRADGTNALPVSSPDVSLNGTPVWSPDSSMITFDTAGSAIFTARADGTQQSLLTTGWGPDWQAIP